MGKLIRLGATALSMIGILVMILCVQAAILFVRLCIRRKQEKLSCNKRKKNVRRIAGRKTVILLAFFL